MNQNFAQNTHNKVGFSLKKDSLASSRASAFQQIPSHESNLPKLQTDANEKKFLQMSGASVVCEDDLYDPLNPTDEFDEPPSPPPLPDKPKKKRKKT